MRHLSIGSFAFMTLVLMVTSLNFFGTTMYMPALPHMMEEMDATTTQVQHTLTYFYPGLALSQLIYGPASDRWGRKPLLIFGMCVTVIATVWCYFAPTMSMLILGRIFQGIGLGAANAIGRSLVRDAYSDAELNRVSSYLAMAISLAPGIVPAMGGFITTAFGWRGIFGFVSVYFTVVLLLILFVMPETNARKNPHALRFPILVQAYGALLKSRNFIGYTIASAAVGGGFMAYGAASPFLYQKLCGLSPDQNGLLFCFTAGSVILGSYLNTHFGPRLGERRMVGFSGALMALSGIVLLLSGLFGFINVPIMLVPSMLFFFGGGFIFPNAFAGAFRDIRELAGFASALFGFLFMSGTFATTYAVALLPETSQIYIAGIFITLSFIILFLQTFIIQEKAPSA